MGLSKQNSGHFHAQLCQLRPPQALAPNPSGVPGRTPLMEQVRIWRSHIVRQIGGRLGAPTTRRHNHGKQNCGKMSVLFPGVVFHHVGRLGILWLYPSQGHRAELRLLNYASIHPTAVVSYKKINVIMWVHSDLSYLLVKKARSRAGRYHYLSDDS